MEEEQYEEEDTIQLMDDESGSLKEKPLTGDHLPFGEMGITPPLAHRVRDVCSVTFDELKKRILQQRHRYFPNDLWNPSSVATEKLITSNTRKNPSAVMAANVAFTTMTYENSEYLLNENVKLRRELATVKKQVEHLAAENQ